MIHYRCLTCNELYPANQEHKCGKKVERAAVVKPAVHKTVDKPVHAVHKPNLVDTPVDNRVSTLIRELAAHGVTLDALEALARGEFALVPTATVVSLGAKADRKAYKREWARKSRAADKQAKNGGDPQAA